MIRLFQVWRECVSGRTSPAATLALAAVFCSAAAAQTGFPFSSETLNYTVNWPSGLSLGEAHLGATRSEGVKGQGDQWSFELALDASVPGFAVADRYRATASSDLCSLTFDKELAHGARKTHESITFDAHDGVAHRDTVGGGKSDIPISGCAHDALTFLYFSRKELGQGRVPQFEDVIFGAPYQVRLQYKGQEQVRVNNKPADADRVEATFKGPASELTFEMFFARDPARTPLVIRVPLSLGSFSLELAR